MGNIGVSNGKVTINLPLTDSLPVADQLALAAAMPEDVTFYDAGGNVLTLSYDAHGNIQFKNSSDKVETPMALQVNEVKSVDIVSTGTVDFVAAGNLNVGTKNGLSLEKAIAGGEVRLTAQEGVTATTGSASSPVITAGGNAILEGGNYGGLGNSTRALFVQTGGSLTAIASDDIYLTETAGCDMKIAEVNANSANAYLTTLGSNSILDWYVSGAEPWEVGGKFVSLTSGGSIGASGNDLGIELSGGTIIAYAPRSIFLDQASGDMDVGLIESAKSDVSP